MPKGFKIDARKLQNPPRTPPKIIQNPFLDASRTGIGNKLEKGTSGIIESGGGWVPKTAPGRFPNGFKNALKFQSLLHFVFTRFSSPLECQQGILNPRKSIKNRCRLACLSWIPFSIRFSSKFYTKMDTPGGQKS